MLVTVTHFPVDRCPVIHFEVEITLRATKSQHQLRLPESADQDQTTRGRQVWSMNCSLCSLCLYADKCWQKQHK